MFEHKTCNFGKEVVFGVKLINGIWNLKLSLDMHFIWKKYLLFCERRNKFFWKIHFWNIFKNLQIFMNKHILKKKSEKEKISMDKRVINNDMAPTIIQLIFQDSPCDTYIAVYSHQSMRKLLIVLVFPNHRVKTINFISRHHYIMGISLWYQ